MTKDFHFAQSQGPLQSSSHSPVQQRLPWLITPLFVLHYLSPTSLMSAFSWLPSIYLSVLRAHPIPNGQEVLAFFKDSSSPLFLVCVFFHSWVFHSLSRFRWVLFTIPMYQLIYEPDILWSRQLFQQQIWMFSCLSDISTHLNQSHLTLRHVQTEPRNSSLRLPPKFWHSSFPNLS